MINDGNDENSSEFEKTLTEERSEIRDMRKKQNQKNNYSII